jgi:hypothetical protein
VGEKLMISCFGVNHPPNIPKPEYPARKDCVGGNPHDWALEQLPFSGAWGQHCRKCGVIDHDNTINDTART